MHILMINDYFGFSAGAFAVAWEMSEELMSRGHKVSFICAVEEGDESREVIQGREVVRIPVQTPMRLRPLLTLHRPGLIGRVMDWVEEFRPDVVHGHVLHLHLSWGLVRALDRRGYPVVLTAHDTGIFCPTKYVCKPPEDPNHPASVRDCAACQRFRYLPGRATLASRLVNRHVRAVAAVSRALAGILEANGVRKVEVIPNGLDPDRLAGEGLSGQEFRQELGLGEEPLVLFGGRLHRLKGDEEALRALARIPRETGAKLVIAGKKELFNRRLQELAMVLDLKDRIILAGWLEREAMLGAYRAASAVLIPSIYPDPFPTVNLEAMALGRPVVGTRFGGTPEVVEQGRTGFIVDPRDAEATARALTELLTDPEKAERMGRAGRERIEGSFSLALQCDRFLDLYQRVM